VKKNAKFWEFSKSVTFLHTFPKREWRLRLPVVAQTPPLRLRLAPGTPPTGDAGSKLTFFAMEPGPPFSPFPPLTLYAS